MLPLLEETVVLLTQRLTFDKQGSRQLTTCLQWEIITFQCNFNDDNRLKDGQQSVEMTKNRGLLKNEQELPWKGLLSNA